jgi:hypothetical protein
MERPEVTGYADIGEVRMEVPAVNCNRLLADSWVLLGAHPLTTVAEMTQGGAGENGEQRKRLDTQRYVRRLEGGEGPSGPRHQRPGPAFRDAHVTPAFAMPCPY